MIFESVAIIWKGASDPDEKRGGLYGGNWFLLFWKNDKNSKNITFIGWFAPIWTILGRQRRLTGLHQHAKSQGGS